jgi:hypothetical protein
MNGVSAHGSCFRRRSFENVPFPAYYIDSCGGHSSTRYYRHACSCSRLQLAAATGTTPCNRNLSRERKSRYCGQQRIAYCDSLCAVWCNAASCAVMPLSRSLMRLQYPRDRQFAHRTSVEGTTLQVVVRNNETKHRIESHIWILNSRANTRYF